MKVMYIGYSDPILTIAQKIAATTPDGCFSIREIIAGTDFSIDDVSIGLLSLLEKDVCDRIRSDGALPFTLDERWVIRIHDLTIGQVYEVLGIEADSYRLLSDHHDPVLYDPSSFHIIDPTEPSCWTCEIGEDGERYCYPHAWQTQDMFEAFHDGDQEAQHRFWHDLHIYYPNGEKT